MRRQFGKTVLDLARQDQRIVVCFGDVFQNLEAYRDEFPDRLFNMGITEQASIAMCAGMAASGLRPIYYTLTLFALERAFEFIKLDVDEMKLPVIIVTYASYPSHGPTQTQLPFWKNVQPFKNIPLIFPTDSDDADRSIRMLHHENRGGVICLTKDEAVK